jgi:hypothetical protein
VTLFPNLTGDASYENARENYTARHVARELTPAEDKALQERLKAEARERRERKASA